MNEKWFSYAVSLSIMLIFINAFITIGASQQNPDGSYNLFLTGLENSNFSYQTTKDNSGFEIEATLGDSSQTPTNEQGYQPVKRTSDGQTAAFNAFDAIITMALGVELIMLTLAVIFFPVAPIFYAIAGFAFFIKAIAAAWLGSMVVRQIFFGRNF